MMFMRFPIDAVFVGRPDDARRRRSPGHLGASGPRRVDRPRAARPRRARRPGAAGRHDRPDRHGGRRPRSRWSLRATRLSRASNAAADPRRVAARIRAARSRACDHPMRGPTSARAGAPGSSTWRSRPSAPAAAGRAIRSARRARRPSTRGWTLPPGVPIGLPADLPAPLAAGGVVRAVRRRRARRAAPLKYARRAAPRRPARRGDGATLGPGGCRRRRPRPGARSIATGPRPRGYDQAVLLAGVAAAASGSRAAARCDAGTRRSRSSSSTVGPGRPTSPARSR